MGGIGGRNPRLLIRLLIASLTRRFNPLTICYTHPPFVRRPRFLFPLLPIHFCRCYLHGPVAFEVTVGDPTLGLFSAWPEPVVRARLRCHRLPITARRTTATAKERGPARGAGPPICTHGILSLNNEQGMDTDPVLSIFCSPSLLADTSRGLSRPGTGKAEPICCTGVHPSG